MLSNLTYRICNGCSSEPQTSTYSWLHGSAKTTSAARRIPACPRSSCPAHQTPSLSSTRGGTHTLTHGLPNSLHPSCSEQGTQSILLILSPPPALWDRRAGNHHQGTDQLRSKELQGVVLLIVKIKSWPRQVFRGSRALAERALDPRCW